MANEMSMFEYHKENIKGFIIDTIFKAQKVYHLISNEFEKGVEEAVLWGIHSNAFSSFTGLKVYYYQNDILAHYEFDNFIEKFSQFSREFISSRSTKHSMQHTYFYYGELVDAYNELAALLELNPIEKPE